MQTIRTNSVLLAFAAGIALAAVAAAAQEPLAEGAGSGVAPPLAALQERARERSPRLGELARRLAAAREEIAPAGALAAPMAEIRLVNMSLGRWLVGSDPMSMIETGVRQELPYPGKRAARRAVAAAAAEALAAEYHAAAQALARDLTALYARLWALDAEAPLLAQAEELYALLAATAAARYAAGEGDQAALLAVQLAISELAERRVALAGERAAVAAELRGLADLPPGEPFGRVVSLPEPVPLAGDLAATAAERAPEVALRRAELAGAARREEVARLDLRPDFALAGGIGWRGSDDPALLLGLGVELPIGRRHRQEPLRRAAAERVAAAGEAHRAAALAARAEAERLLAAWERTAAQLRLFDEALLPQSAAAFDAARASYLATRGDFSPVIESARRWLDLRVRRAGLVAERLTLRAALAALLDEPTLPATGAGDRP